MDSLGKLLRELRQNAGYSVREFAKLIEKSPGYVSRIETRDEIPAPELLCKIAEIHRIGPDRLLDLARRSQVARAEQEITDRYESALSLYRKDKKK